MSGILGGLFPAIRAASISPLEALAIRARAPQPRTLIIATAAAFAAIGVWALGLLPESRDTRFWLYVMGGLPLLHIAWFVLSVPITLVVARVFSNRMDSRLIWVLPGIGCRIFLKPILDVLVQIWPIFDLFLILIDRFRLKNRQ